MDAGADGAPPHAHPRTESVYVLEGSVRYHIGEDTFDGGPGSFFHIPAGTLEFFEPTEETRVLVAYTPGGIDKFFAEAGEPAAGPRLPPAPEGPPDLERLTSIAAQYGMEIQQPAGKAAVWSSGGRRSPGVLASLCIVLGKRSRRFHGRHI